MKIFKPVTKIYWAFLISVATYLIFLGKFLLPNYYFWGSDATLFYYPSRFYLYERVFEDKSFPFWTERQYLGFPIYKDAENGYLNLINVLSILIFGPDLSYKVLHFVFYLIGSISFYIFLKRKEINLLGFFVANLIFYFSTYLLNHQIHFNIILTFYLFPAGILLTDLYIEKTKVKYLVFLSIIISFSILFGHLQSALIFSFGIFLYYLVFNFTNFLSFKTLLFGVSMIFLILIQTLPQLLPTSDFYTRSERSQTINLYKGSYFPVMTTFAFLPYVFGDISNYKGLSIKQDFSYTELYIYSGITSFLILGFVLVFFKTSKIVWFGYLSLWIYLIFSMLRYNEFFNEETPLISLFRYWERIFILTNFGVAILVAKFVSNPFMIETKNLRWRIWLVIVPVIYIIHYQLNISKNIEFSERVLKFFLLSKLSESQYFLPFFAIFIICCLILVFVLLIYKLNLDSRYRKAIVILLTTVIFVDLYYFSLDVVNYRLQDISSYKIPVINLGEEDQRSIFVNFEISSLEYLRPKSWSLFGYSQFQELEYKEYLVKNGFLDTFGRVGLPINENQAKEFGVTQIFIKNEKGQNEVVKINYEGSDLIKNKIETKFLKRKSGHIIFSYNSAEDISIKTRIKYSKNWEVKINGENVDYNRDGIFFEFKAPKGENVVEISYIPKSFYLGLKISATLFLLFMILLYIFKKKNLYKSIQ